MIASLVKRTSAALLLLAAAAVSPAYAQRYDGGGLLKFGVFGQGTFLDLAIQQPGSGSASPGGLGVGVSFGYDIRTGSGFLYGIEADGSFGDARSTALGTGYGFDYLATLRGRAGFYTRPDLLIYGTAGVAFLGFEAQPTNGGSKAYETLTGYTVGVGAEWDLAHTLLFAEYLYAGFGDRQFNVDAVRHDVDADAHLLRFGIKFKTGHDFEHGVSRGSYDPLK